MRSFNKLLGLTSQEIHAFTIGFFEVLPPWKAQYHDALPVPGYLKDEQHYYKGGRWIGSIIALLILIGLAKLLKEVLL